MYDFEFDVVILGEVASAKNQRRIVGLNRGKSGSIAKSGRSQGVPRIIKSAKALAYAKSFELQCPVLDNLIEGDLAIWIDAYYASRRPDLSCLDLIKDLLQGKAYSNDRSVKAETAIWNLDKENPRARIRLRRIQTPSKGYTEMSSLAHSEIWGQALPSSQQK